MRMANLTRVRGFLEARLESSSSSDLRLEGVKPPVSGVIAGRFLGMGCARDACARGGTARRGEGGGTTEGEDKE